jgi:hypothetical protein
MINYYHVQNIFNLTFKLTIKLHLTSAEVGLVALIWAHPGKAISYSNDAYRFVSKHEFVLIYWQLIISKFADFNTDPQDKEQFWTRCRCSIKDLPAVVGSSNPANSILCHSQTEGELFCRPSSSSFVDSIGQCLTAQLRVFISHQPQSFFSFLGGPSVPIDPGWSSRDGSMEKIWSQSGSGRRHDPTPSSSHLRLSAAI